MSTRATSNWAYARDAKRLRKLAQDVIRQVGFFEDNTAEGHNDEIRWLFIANEVQKMLAVTMRAERRYWRESMEAQA